MIDLISCIWYPRYYFLLWFMVSSKSNISDTFLLDYKSETKIEKLHLRKRFNNLHPRTLVLKSYFSILFQLDITLKWTAWQENLEYQSMQCLFWWDNSGFGICGCDLFNSGFDLELTVALPLIVWCWHCYYL